MFRLNCLILFFVMLISSTAFAQVEDGAKLLNQSDLQQLNSKIEQIERKHGIQIGIVTEKTIQNQSPELAANSLLKSKFNGGSNGNIVLLIVMDTRKWQISTDSKMDQKITNEYGLPYIENNFLSKLSGQDYSGAFNAYVNDVDELLSYYQQNGEAYDPSKGFNPMAAVTALVISIFIGVMIRSSLIASMSNVRPAVEASEYLDKSSVQLTENRDTFLYMNVRRQPKNRGGSGGSHGGGGSSGGGGGRGGSF